MNNQVITNPPTQHKETLKRFWLSTRDRLLGQIDDIERALGIEPRTAEIRAWYREWAKKAKKVCPCCTHRNMLDAQKCFFCGEPL